MRERRRAERKGLDDAALDVYASEVYEERRSRRRSRVVFQLADRWDAYAVIAAFDQISPQGEATKNAWLREHQRQLAEANT